MTKIEELEKKLEECQKDIEKLKKEEKKGKWKPKNGEEFWFINDWYEISKADWDSEKDCQYLYYLGNCFQTEKEAKNHAYNLETKMLLQKYADEHNEAEIDWENKEQCKYFMEYCFEYNEILYNFTDSFKCAETIYFTNEKILDNAVKEIGEGKIIKYLKEM